MKIKRFGKNKNALNKILANPKVKVIDFAGTECKELLKILVGSDFNFKAIKDCLELTDRMGDTFYIKGINEEIEIV